MGRLAKNLELHSGSYAIRMPVGSNVLAPQRPQAGQVRFNMSNNYLEVFYGSAWHSLGQAGRVTIDKDSFVGDGVANSFTMLKAPFGTEGYGPDREAEVLVFISGVFQEPKVAYTVEGAIISFTGTPDIGMPIVVLHNFNSTHVR